MELSRFTSRGEGGAFVPTATMPGVLFALLLLLQGGGGAAAAAATAATSRNYVQLGGALSAMMLMAVPPVFVDATCHWHSSSTFNGCGCTPSAGGCTASNWYCPGGYSGANGKGEGDSTTGCRTYVCGARSRKRHDGYYGRWDRCNGHGECSTSSSNGNYYQCSCDAGFTGTATTHNPGGDCDRCKPNFTGTNCETCKPNFTGTNCDANTCTECPANTYNPFDVHQETACIDQPPCNPGFRFVGTSEVKRTCVPCVDNTYISTPNHLITDCTAQPTCDTGQFSSPASNVVQQTCKACPQYTFQAETNHRIESCTDQLPCDSGSRYYAAPTFERTCLPCSENTYIDTTSHRLINCKKQPLCGVGQRISKTSKAARQSCSSCPQHTFQSDPSHRKESCTNQPTCSPGFHLPASVKAEQNCTRCTAGTFVGANNHRIKECADQPTCDAGFKISAASTVEQQTCTKCEAWTRNDAENHRIEACTPWKTCDRGSKFAAGTPTNEATCTPCGKGTFMNATNHREEACFQHVNCTAGEAIAIDDPERQRECKACGLHTYQNLTSHRVEACIPQPGCPRGHAYYAENTARERQCLPCASGKYMPSDDHRKNECTEQTQCNRGEKISAASTTAAQSCTPCENNTFVDATNHREERCTPHATCGPGEYSSAPDPIRQRTCLPCGLHTYQNLTSHRVEACKVQPVCEPGEYYALLPLASKAAKAECRPCTNGTYQDEQQHRNDKCEEQIKCLETEGIVLNYTGSITEASGCIALTVQSLDSGSGEASTTIAIAAAVAVFVILALVIVVIRKRSGENEKKLRFDFEEKLIEFQLQQQAVRDEKGQHDVDEEEEEEAPPLVPRRIKDFEVDQAKLTRVATLGHGNFGEVYKCHLDGQTLPVAAKVVRIDEKKVKAEDREAHLREETTNLKREAVVMMGLGSNHPHVVSLVGIITSTGNLTVILTLEANGDLKQFLETNVKDGTPVLLEEKRRWIWQNGSKPYPQLSNVGLMRQYDDPNFVHPKPGDDCSEALYSLLKECWLRDPTQRPSFPQILKRLEKMDGGIKRAFADQDNLPIDALAITIVEETKDVGGAARPRAVVQSALTVQAALTTEDANDGYEPYSEDANDGYEPYSEDEDGGSTDYGPRIQAAAPPSTSHANAAAGGDTDGLAQAAADGYARGLPQLQCIQKTKKSEGGQCTQLQTFASRYCVDHTCPYTGCTASKSSRLNACKNHIKGVRNTGSTVVNPAFERSAVDGGAGEADNEYLSVAAGLSAVVDDDSDDFEC
eukprot:gene2282-3992_t